MIIIQFIKKFFENIVIYVVFITAVSWIFLIVMVIVLVWQIFLLIFRVKCSDDNFKKAINEEIDKKLKENE